VEKKRRDSLIFGLPKAQNLTHAQTGSHRFQVLKNICTAIIKNIPVKQEMQKNMRPTFDIVHLDGIQIIPDIAALDRMSSGRSQRVNPKFAEIKESILAEAAPLVEPVAVWARVEAEQFPLLPERLARTFSGAEAMLGVVCTIGEKLERQSHNYFAGQETIRGYFLDLTGTLAVANLAQKIAADLRGQYGAIHWAPGDDPSDLSLDAQRLLFEIVPIHQIGMRLTQQNVMVPMKSLSFFLVIGAHTGGLSCSIPCIQCAWNGMCDKRLQRIAGGNLA
jgi:hypothetical protein